MKNKAKVYLFEKLVGEIQEDENGEFTFQYSQEYLGLKDSRQISYSLPLQEEAYRSQYLLGFFDGLLPEGWLLQVASEHWKFNPLRDRYDLLLKSCYDPIGAVSIIEDGSKISKVDYNNSTEEIKIKNRFGKCLYCYEKIEVGLYHDKCAKSLFGEPSSPIIDLNEEIIKEISKQLIISGQSIAGVQKKIALEITKNNKESRLTLTNFAGNFILKPQGHIPHVPENEDLIMKLASSYGLEIAKTGLMLLENGDFVLLSRRVDRIKNKKYHMEDFCQILNQVTMKKYTSSYKKVGKALEDYCKGNAPKEQVLKLFEYHSLFILSRKFRFAP